MSLTLKQVPFIQFAAYCEALEGSFIQITKKVTSRSLSYRMSVPRRSGERPPDFYKHLDGSGRLNPDGSAAEVVRLSKSEKDFIKALFEVSDAAMAEVGVEAGRIEIFKSSTGAFDCKLAGSDKQGTDLTGAEAFVESATSAVKATLKAEAAKRAEAAKLEKAEEIEWRAKLAAMGMD